MMLFFFFFFGGCVLGLHCCAQAFSSCGQRGLLFIAVRSLLIAVASPVAGHRLQACGLQQLWHAGSVVVAHGLQSAGSVVVAHGLSCSAACGIFPDQGSNLCPLHWQADSQPLCHQGSPSDAFIGQFIQSKCALRTHHSSLILLKSFFSLSFHCDVERLMIKVYSLV